jgi:hypothetical protein
MHAPEQISKSILTPANVNVKQFGMLFSFPVDGPIPTRSRSIWRERRAWQRARQSQRPYVATEHDSVYAFDADGKTSEPLLKISFAHPEAGVTPVPARDVDCPFISPEVGITSHR